jgi:hypothetical protein
MKGRYGWILLLLVVAAWDIAAALTNGESLTYVFRRGVAESAWRWPVFAVIVVLVVHLYLPPRFQKYDPLDKVYERIQPSAPSPPRPPPKPPARPAPNVPGQPD